MGRPADHLSIHSKLDHYQIDKVLGGGGFSIVYLATDTKTDQTVVIKEYFPIKLAKRGEDFSVIAKDESTEKYFKQGRKLFFQEASILAAIKHQNVVEILGFIQANDTIYSVMSYYPGLSLQAYLKKLGKYRDEKFILNIFIPILKGLSAVHKMGLLHLDIKPGNIYLRQGLPPILLDFGAVHKLILSSGSRLFPVVSHGFSPPEQSSRRSKLGPWSDLYAVGATMRACIESKPPPPAKERVKKNTMTPAIALYKEKYSNRLLKAIDWAMELDIKERPQSVEEFVAVLTPLIAKINSVAVDKQPPDTTL